MSNARKLAMLALSAFAIMALAASTASAVSVSKETPPSVLCDVTVTEEGANNCPLRSEANDIELGAPFGIMYTCDVTLEGYVNRTGHAIASTYDVVEPCEGSDVHNCTTAGRRHPEAQIGTLIPPGTAEAGVHNLEADFCVRGPFGEIPCHVAGTLARTSTHRYSMAFVHTNKCEENWAYSLQGVFPLLSDAAHPGYELS